MCGLEKQYEWKNHDEFDAFMASEEGQKSLDIELNYSDHIYKNKSNNLLADQVEEDESDEEDEGVNDNIDSEEEFFEDFNEEAEFLESEPTEHFSDDDTFVHQPTKGNKLKTNKKGSVKDDMNNFDMILEENTKAPSNAGGSSAVRNFDKASVKQLKWEQKYMDQDMVAKKKKLKSKHKRNASHFNNKNNARPFNKKRKFK